jgi:hypothetical protein
MRILDDMGYILETKCLTPEAMEKAVLSIQHEFKGTRQEDGLDVMFFNHVLAVCVNEVGIHLRRELSVDEKIFVGHQVYTFLITREGAEPWKT